MNNIERAAVLLLGVGEKEASEVFKYLEPKNVEKVIKSMASLSGVTIEEINNTLNQFNSDSQKQTSLTLNTKDYIRTALVNAVGEDKATTIIDRSIPESPCLGIEKLRWYDAKTIMALIQDEHPQIIAVILSYLEPDQRASVIGEFPKEEMSEIVKRLAKLTSISPLALQELSDFLEAEIKEIRSFKEPPANGEKLVADMINFMSASLENEVITTLAENDPELSEKIKEMMFPFDSLCNLDKRSLQTLLREVSKDDLTYALKGADETIKKSFLENMSERAAEMLLDDIEALGPVQLSKVVAAQKNIVATAQRLAKDGSIALANDCDAMVS